MSDYFKERQIHLDARMIEIADKFRRAGFTLGYEDGCHGEAWIQNDTTGTLYFDPENNIGKWILRAEGTAEAIVSVYVKAADDSGDE